MRFGSNYLFFFYVCVTLQYYDSSCLVGYLSKCVSLLALLSVCLSF